jgi:tetratricopeptide (TPR) repeat protein
MLGGLCRYDTPKLLDLAATVDRQYMVLCEFMAYLTVEHAECYDLYKQAGKFILEATPFCDRVSDSLCSRFVGDDLSALTANLLSNTVELYRIELPRIADLPHSVAISWEAAHKNTDLAADIANVSRAFVDATEESEPSWSALGNMLQETNFSQTYQRMWSMTMGYASGDPNEFAADAKKLVQGNSCAALIDGMLAKHQNQPLPSALQNINLPFPSFHYPLNDPWDILGKDRKEWDSFWNLTWDHFDATAWDCEDNLVWFKFKPDPSPQVFSHADMLSVLSPFSPNGAAWRIRTIYLKKPADQAVKELERRFADKTAVAAAASYYFSLNYKFADAIIPLQAFAKQSQDPSYYEELAYCYLQTGDENHWLSAMEEGISIAIDDSTKAKMNSSIALQLLGEGKYEKAMQYGDSAVQFGQTGDTLANSLVIAGPCHAAMGDFKTADDLINKLPDQDSSWDTSVYYWRRVTGRGDLDAIRKAALVSFGSQPEGIDAAGICHGEGDSANERRILQAMYDKQPVAYYGLSLLLLDYKAGNQDAVDRTLTTLQKNFTLWQEFEYHKAFQEAVRWIERERGFQNGKSGKPFDREPVAEVLANLRKYSETNRVDVEFVIGEYLLTEGGNNEQALALLRDTAMFSPISSYSGFIARLDLAKRHIDPFHPNAPATRPAAHPGL